MRRAVLVIILTLILVIITGCGASRQNKAEYSYSRGSQPAEQSQKVAEAVKDQSLPSLTGKVAQAAEAGSLAERKVIKNAEVSLEVEDVIATVKTIETRVATLGGFVSEANVSSWKRQENRSAHMTLRIPAQRFTGFMHELEQLGKVGSKREWIDDVTEEYIDLSARIQVLEAEEESLLGILRKAEQVEDMLAVKRELSRVRQERESLTGRLNYLRDRVQYSTINLSLYQVVASENTVDASGLAGVWEDGTKAFTKSLNMLLNGLGTVIIFVFAAAPVALPLILLGWAAWVINRRRNRSKPRQNVNDT